MCDANNTMVQGDGLFGSGCIEYRAVCDRSLEAEESSTQKLTFGIERLLSMPATAKREIKRCETLLPPSCKLDNHSHNDIRKWECCEEYKGNEFLSNFSKFFISDSDSKMRRSKYTDSVCEPDHQTYRRNIEQCGETVDYVTFGSACESDNRYSKLICKPLPLRIGGVHLGQGDIIYHQTIDTLAFPQTTTTSSHVESWPDDTISRHIDKCNDCSVFKTQIPSVDLNSLRSNNGVTAAFNKSGAQSIISRRKRSWSRAVFSSLQRKGLEKTFQEQKYITKPDRKRLAATLGLHDAQVKVWFQNRRMKWRHMIKNASLFSMSQHKEVKQSQTVSSSYMNSEMAEILALEVNEDTEDDDVIID